jgi:hypothetical protein
MSSLLTSHTENSFSSLCLWISGGDFDSTDFYCLDVRGRKSTRKLCIAVSKKNIYDHILYVCVCIHIYIFIYLFIYICICGHVFNLPDVPGQNATTCQGMPS